MNFFFCRQCDCEVAKDSEQIDVAPCTLDEGISTQELMGKTVSGQEVKCLKKQHMSSGEVTPSTSEGNQSARTESSMDDEKRQTKKERLHSKQSARSEHSMDEETKKAEKERLHAMIKAFSKEALVGLDCKLLENTQGSCVNIKFSFDRALTIMTMKNSDHDKKVSLMDVEEIYSYEDLVEEVPDSHIGSMFAKEDRSKGVFIQHRDQTCKDPWTCLLVRDETEVEKYVASLKVLKLHAQAKGASMSKA